jgi:hypothetical protein
MIEHITASWFGGTIHRLQIAAQGLFPLNCGKERSDVPAAKTFCSFSLDEFKK